MHLQTPLDALTSFPCDTLPTPEAWRRSTRPAGWTGCPSLEELFGEWLDRDCADEVILPPELDAAYDLAIDAAFEKVMNLLCAPVRKNL